MSWIQQFPLFENLPDDVAERLERRCRKNLYKPYSVVVDFNDASSEVWFLVKGQARVLLRTEAGKELVLRKMEPGNLFGEMAALDGQQRSASITTLEHSELWSMHGEEFLDAATSIPEVARTLLSMFASRIRAMNEQVREHAFMTNRQRLCAELVRHARPRAANPAQLIISPPPPHKELANTLGIMREAVTREMSILRKAGLLENSRGGCIIPDPAAFDALISGE